MNTIHEPYEVQNEAVPAIRPHILKKRWFRASCAITLVVALSGGVSSLVASFSEPKTVVFDMKNTIDAFQQQTAQMQLTKEALEGVTKRFGDALDTSLRQWQEKHHALVLVKGAVVSGVPDITTEIQADIARQMQGGQ